VETNSAFSGGGIFVEASSALVRRNRLIGNFALGGGGGGAALRSVPVAGSLQPGVFANNYVIDNMSLTTGGGLFCDLSNDAVATSNTFIGNAANQSGAGIHVAGCTIDITNNIIANSLLSQGVFCQAGSIPTLGPNLFFNNFLSDVSGACLGNAADVQAAPGFLAGTCFGDLRLAPDSPAVDAGTNAAPIFPALDLEGDTRPHDGNIDLLPVIDLGADEFVCADKDNDGLTACTSPIDCDDTNPAVNPFAEEVCDGIDNDCDCQVDEGATDGDGDGVTTCAGDCNDGDPAVNPGAVEACDGIDNNCNGAIDEGFLDNCVPGARVALELGDGFGEAGMTASVTASLALIDPSAQVSATANDIAYDASLFGGVPPACVVSPTLLDKAVSQNIVAPGLLRVVIIGDNNNLIPAGDLYSCSFQISGAAEPGTFALITDASASDPGGLPLPANGGAGSITVLQDPGTVAGGSIIGDCNGDQSVSISELQLVRNIFLSISPVSACLAADANVDGIVDITEVQNATNNLLNGP
jgi:hypothetical protein